MQYNFKHCPIGCSCRNFLGDNVIIRAYYRYYSDDWNVKSNTADIEIPLKISPFFSLSPFSRTTGLNANIVSLNLKYK